MPTIDITEFTFAETLQNNEVVFVEFWAEWCPPCRIFASTYGSAAQRHPDITFAKVDAEAEKTLTFKAGITSIPTLLAYKNKALVFSQPGTLNATGLEDVIQAVKNTDADKPLIDAALQHHS